MIQESPIHNFKLLRQNLFQNMVKKKNRRESIMAVNTMKDLLMNNVMPNRKLRLLFELFSFKFIFFFKYKLKFYFSKYINY